MKTDIGRRLFAEALGSLLLAGTVIGSGILASRLSGGNDAVALLGNTAATAAILFVIITVLGPISGAHFNPAVTLVMALRREIAAGAALAYVPFQVIGCIAGAWLAHAMFALPLIQLSTHVRAGSAQMLSEGVATFALVFCILATSRWRPDAAPAAVALVIAAGYWWTSSTSFANPAITIARAMSDTFAGVRPADAPGFVAAQCAGALIASGIWSVLAPRRKEWWCEQSIENPSLGKTGPVSAIFTENRPIFQEQAGFEDGDALKPICSAVFRCFYRRAEQARNRYQEQVETGAKQVCNWPR